MDAKSIDSGVVQSDQSANLAATNYTSPPPPKTISTRVGVLAVPSKSKQIKQHYALTHPPPIRPGVLQWAQWSAHLECLPWVGVKSQQRGTALNRRDMAGGSRPESGHSSDFMPGSTSGDCLTGAVSALERVEEGNSRRSNQSSSLTRKESEYSETESPTFMSSPEDDSSTLAPYNSTSLTCRLINNCCSFIVSNYILYCRTSKPMDKNGFSDPYVKFHLIPGNTKATKLSSKTIEKTLNPEWHEEMIYYGITEEDRLRKVLRLTVLDRDRIGSDFLGETRVALKSCQWNNKEIQPLLGARNASQLEKRRGGTRKILVSVCYNIQQGSLFVNIKRCAELLGMDSTGFSDPYCKVSLTPLSSKAHRQKTSIKKRTLNPEFNTTLQFIVPFKDLPKKTLEISVYDHDVARSDDFIGGILLSTAAKDERGNSGFNA
uniref:C2 domain-containing protein n=1 Tax=Ditylenchus dipsaci TaxID=166011 RepID=A0A915DHC2_9BILA